jgi:hypothetical protein
MLDNQRELEAIFEREPSLLSLLSERVTAIRMDFIAAKDIALEAVNNCDENEMRETFEEAIDKMLDGLDEISMLPGQVALK